MTMRKPFDFNSAVCLLEEFLELQSLPLRIEWVFAEDLVWTGSQLNARAPISAENKEVMRSIIESENAQTHGVEIRAVARTANATLCGLVLPEDERQAEEMMIDGLKLSVPNRLQDAVVVSGTIRWRLLRLRHREPSPFSGILERRDDLRRI